MDAGNRRLATVVTLIQQVAKMLHNGQWQKYIGRSSTSLTVMSLSNHKQEGLFIRLPAMNARSLSSLDPAARLE
jgi:hypothetical protein